MLPIFETLTIAFGVILLAFALLGIGYMITGKMKIKPGACGRAPTQKRDEKCGTETTCHLCEPGKDEKNELQ